VNVKLKLKTNDPVIVTTGKDKGTKSKIVKLDKAGGKVICENVNVYKKHMKPNQFNPDGGIVDKSMPLEISNIAYYCDKCSKGVKIGYKVLESGKKVRFCRSCSEIIDKD